ncbi:MAG: permease [bacterium JZ-2024 1]
MQKDKVNNMDWSFFVLLTLLAFALLLLYAFQGWQGVKEGNIAGVKMLVEVFPRIFLGLMLAGITLQLIPQETFSTWMGKEAGWRGIFLGTIAGILTPGGPFLYYPLLAALMKAGAGAGAVSAYLTAWSLMNLNRTIIWEVPFLGIPFTFARIIPSLLLPIFIGYVTSILYYQWFH